MDPILNRCHEFQQLENHLFKLLEKSNSQQVLGKFFRLPKHYAFCMVSTLVTEYLNGNSNSCPFRLNEVALDEAFDSLIKLMINCYSYIRSLRRIQRWWRHHYYGPKGRGFHRAQDDFNSHIDA
jgi:hypothetical protein